MFVNGRVYLGLDPPPGLTVNCLFLHAVNIYLGSKKGLKWIRFQKFLNFIKILGKIRSFFIIYFEEEKNKFLEDASVKYASSFTCSLRYVQKIFLGEGGGLVKQLK